MGMKDQIRGKVQADLERLASGCRDMATLLRLLHIPVEGGLSPTPQQVRYLIDFSELDHDYNSVVSKKRSKTLFLI